MRLFSSAMAMTAAILAAPAASDAVAAGSPFADAVAVWHMADVKNATGKSESLAIQGNVKLGVELTGADREASLKRGGDGRVAQFEGGYLVAGKDANESLSLTGHALSIGLRLRDPSGRWAAGLLSKKGPTKNYNLFAWDVGGGMEFGFEFNLRGEPSFTQVKAPLEGLAFDGWHDLVIRYNGVKLELFIDGLLRAQKPVRGQLAEAPEASLLIGADPGGRNVFYGLVDHAALWNRALTDAEVEFLCGGREGVEQAKAVESAARRESRRERARPVEEKLREARQRILVDPYYPKYHVAPSVGWMNDPHPVWFKGAYHIFYQHSCLPDDPYGGPHHWGHAESNDLVHWHHLPAAITPKDNGISPDRHIWSGCVVDHGGVGTAIYTIDNIDVWISTSADDNLERFEKHPGNPVIHGPPPGLAIEGGMRDPWVWKEADGWYLIVGSGLKGRKGAVLPLYRSTDLVHWKYLHPLYEDTSGQIGTFCECPAFFPLGDKYVLLISNQATYLVGRYEDHRFVPERRGRLDYGSVYVPQTVLDGKGRRILWGWVLETRVRDAQRKAGWAGMQTLPRVLSLQPDDTLAFSPAKELESLRSGHREFSNIRLAADSTHVLEGVQGPQLEIAAEFAPVQNGAAGLALSAGRQKMEVVFDAKTKTLNCQGRIAPLQLAAGEPLALRVFVDGSVLEVFANRRACITQRMYLEKPETLQAALLSRGEAATATKVDAWKMGTIWRDREQPITSP